MMDAEVLNNEQMAKLKTTISNLLNAKVDEAFKGDATTKWQSKLYEAYKYRHEMFDVINSAEEEIEKLEARAEKVAGIVMQPTSTIVNDTKTFCDYLIAQGYKLDDVAPLVISMTQALSYEQWQNTKAEAWGRNKKNNPFE